MENVEKKKREDQVAKAVVDVVFQVHRKLGAGLFESVYEEIVTYELEKRGLRVQRQLPIPVHWDGHVLGDGYRADLIVEGMVLIELKSVEVLPPVATKQILTYLELTRIRLGLLVNFGAATFSDCVRRFASKHRLNS